MYKRMMHMKRTLLMAASLLLLLPLGGCKKDDPSKNLLKPTLTWEGNDKFSAQTIRSVSAMNGTVTYEAPEGLENLQITATVPTVLIGVVNQMIGISSNAGKSSSPAILDLVNDTKLAGVLTPLGFNAGSSIKGRKAAGKLDFARLLEALIKDNENTLSTGDTFKFDVLLTDREGQKVSKTASFNYVEGPTISGIDAPVNLSGEETDLELDIKADGKLQSLLLSIEGNSEFIKKWFQARSSAPGDPVKVDLVSDETAVKELARWFPTSKIQGQTEVTLDFSFLYDLVPDMKAEGASTTNISVTAIDENDKSALKVFAVSVSQ